MVHIVWTVLLIVIAIGDIQKRKIPDYLVIVGLVCGCLNAVYCEVPDVLHRLSGMAVSTMIFFVILFLAPGSFGGGDVKLSGVIGFYLGVELWMKSFVIAVMSAGVYVVYRIVWKKDGRKAEIAFGPFLCLGALIGTGYLLM